MKILFITSLLGKEYGGAEVSTRLLLEKLIEEGHEVKALTTRKVKNDPNLISISFPIEIPKKLLTVGNLLLDRLLARKIKTQIELIKPDVIHIQDTYILPATVIANKQLKTPSVATIRNSVLDTTWDIMFSKPISTILKRRNKPIIKALHKINSVISVSEYIKTELIQRGIEDIKIFPIYNLPPTFNTDVSKAATKNDSVVQLFAPGFLAKFKGFLVLVKAMREVVNQNPKVHLIIAGDGPEKKKLEKLSTELNLEQYIDFTGRTPFTNLPEFYAKSDIVIFPSIYQEPFGRVALEAAYFGKPVIASRVGGIPEIVKDRETGVLVSPGDPEELSKVILMLCSDYRLRRTMGKKAKTEALMKFDAIIALTQHLEPYNRAVLRHGGLS